MLRRLTRKVAGTLERRVIGPALSPLRRGAVAMFHVGRSGSTVVGDLADQHPWIYWASEIYEHTLRDRDARNLPDGPWDPYEVLRTRMRESGPRYFGFEVKFFHLELAGVGIADYLEHIERLGVTHVVVLERANLLRKVASSVAAAASSRYHLRAGQTQSLRRIELPIEAVPIDRQRRPLVELLQHYRDEFDRLEQALSGRRHLWLTYEHDVLDDPRVAYTRLVGHLGLRALRPRVRYAKTNPHPVRSMLDNADAVEVALAGTPFAWMLDG